MKVASIHNLASIALSLNFAMNVAHPTFATESTIPPVGPSRWVSRSSGLAGTDLVDVTFGGGLFAAIGGKSIVISTDGVN